MGQKLKVKTDDRLPLTKALRLLKAKYPWAPETALRNAVRDGIIPTVRSSFAKRARFYVRMDDLEALLLRTENR